MANIMHVIVSQVEVDFNKPLPNNHIAFDIDGEKPEEYRAFLHSASLWCDKGLYVYTRWDDKSTINVSRAYNDMKEFEKRHPDA